MIVKLDYDMGAEYSTVDDGTRLICLRRSGFCQIKDGRVEGGSCRATENDIGDAANKELQTVQQRRVKNHFLDIEALDPRSKPRREEQPPNLELPGEGRQLHGTRIA